MNKADVVVTSGFAGGWGGVQRSDVICNIFKYTSVVAQKPHSTR